MTRFVMFKHDGSYCVLDTNNGHVVARFPTFQSAYNEAYRRNEQEAKKRG